MKMKNWMRSAGFTLVELIVVIAVLGILGAGAAVGYSGYVKKANKAADEALFKQIDYAADVGRISDADSSTYGFVHLHKDADASAVAGDGITQSPVIDEWMSRAFGADWKKSLRLKAQDEYSHVVKSPAQSDAINAFNNSNFEGKEEDLAALVGNLSGMLATDANISALKNVLGEETYAELLTKYNLGSNPSNTQIANAAVMYVASQAKNMDAAALLNEIKTTGSIDISSDSNDAISLAALAYGTMYGYANSQYATADFKNEFFDSETGKPKPVTGISSVMTLFNKMSTDAGCSNYMNASEDGALADMEGYLSAMRVIDDYQNSFNLESESAFTDPAVMALLQGLLG